MPRPIGPSPTTISSDRVRYSLYWLFRPFDPGTGGGNLSAKVGSNLCLRSKSRSVRPEGCFGGIVLPPRLSPGNYRAAKRPGLGGVGTRPWSLSRSRSQRATWWLYRDHARHLRHRLGHRVRQMKNRINHVVKNGLTTFPTAAGRAGSPRRAAARLQARVTRPFSGQRNGGAMSGRRAL